MSVGETLSHARRSLGLSLDDVSADTRIRASVIASIESDDFTSCGGAVYARGHIRSISRVVGVDPDPLLAEFDAAHQVELPPVASAVAPQATDPDLLARSEHHRPNWTAAMAVTLAAICIFALIGLVISHKGGKSHGHQTAQSVTGPKQTHPPVTPPPTSVAELPVSKVTMLIRAVRGNTWLQVTRHNGRVMFSSLVYTGQAKVFSSKGGLSFIIGNAPAVDVVVNGHDLGTPQSQGNVARGSVSPGSDAIEPA
ncbi:MAG TPA: RodZ domain-containing protein [Mycobacteriales bacterium]|nr:RodZ domain-containing protein [Mycobacteriales bacterium]